VVIAADALDRIVPHHGAICGVGWWAIASFWAGGHASVNGIRASDFAATAFSGPRDHPVPTSIATHSDAAARQWVVIPHHT